MPRDRVEESRWKPERALHRAIEKAKCRPGGEIFGWEAEEVVEMPARPPDRELREEGGEAALADVPCRRRPGARIAKRPCAADAKRSGLREALAQPHRDGNADRVAHQLPAEPLLLRLLGRAPQMRNARGCARRSPSHIATGTLTALPTSFQ